MAAVVKSPDANWIQKTTHDLSGANSTHGHLTVKLGDSAILGFPFCNCLVT
jgi:hypothetical protein